MKSIIMLSCKLRFPTHHYIHRLSHCKQYCHTKSTLSEQYQTLIASNTIQYDAKQERVVKELDTLYHQIQHYNAPKLPDKPCLEASAGTFDKKASTTQSKSKSARKSKPGIFQQLLNIAKPDPIWSPPPTADIPHSLYVWGGTGTGKTMLMDLFYDSITSHSKQRVHFNTFMLELHAEIHQLKNKQHSSSTDEDVLPLLSLNMAKKCTIFYLDEFQVTDLVDALLLNRLLTSLFHYGVVLFVTSNREPDTLYLNGLQREQIFVPFLKLLQQKSVVIDLNTMNYRDLGYGYGYFTDLEPFEEAWNEMINVSDGESMEVVQIMAGRQLECPRSIGRTVTRFKFRELCARSKGTADYLALSKSFRTVFIEKIPLFGYDPESRNEMKRFIWLIDELYNGKNRIVCLAAERPEQLLRADEDGEKHVFEEIFQFERCKKRLIEMQSIQYLEETKDIL